nr:MAG TPA: hypothetical protein [Caudoviricetes sp.]
MIFSVRYIPSVASTFYASISKHVVSIKIGLTPYNIKSTCFL